MPQPTCLSGTMMIVCNHSGGLAKLASLGSSRCMRMDRGPHVGDFGHHAAHPGDQGHETYMARTLRSRLVGRRSCSHRSCRSILAFLARGTVSHGMMPSADGNVRQSVCEHTP